MSTSSKPALPLFLELCQSSFLTILLITVTELHRAQRSFVEFAAMQHGATGLQKLLVASLLTLFTCSQASPPELVYIESSNPSLLAAFSV